MSQVLTVKLLATARAQTRIKVALSDWLLFSERSLVVQIKVATFGKALLSLSELAYFIKSLPSSFSDLLVQMLQNSEISFGLVI